MAVELYPHQRKAVEELGNGKILWGDVGTGKSLTAAAYYIEKEAPKDVIVITTAKKRDSLDWEHEFVRFGVGRSREGSVAGRLEVDSWNNLGNYVDRRNTFFVFDEQRLVGSGKWTKDFLRITQGHGNRWILLSATPGDTWMDYIPVFIANGFYKNRTEFLREHVVYSRWSKFPKIDRYLGVGKLVRLRNSLLVHMPFERSTTRRVTTVKVAHDEDLFRKVLTERWNPYKQRPLRDVAELFLVMRKVVNSSSTRVEAVRELMQKHPKLIVFYNFDYELEALRQLAHSTSTDSAMPISETSSNERSISSTLEVSEWNGDERCLVVGDSKSQETAHSVSNTTNARMNGNEPTRIPAGTTSSEELGATMETISSSASVAIPLSTQPSSMSESTNTTSTTTYSSGQDLVVAEWNGHKHQPIPTSGRWLYLVQYQAGAEGWNCVETDAMCFFSLTYSYKIFHQAMGRIDRLNTPFLKLHYYLLVSDSVIDKLIWKALKSKKSFNEKMATQELGAITL